MTSRTKAIICAALMWLSLSVRADVPEQLNWQPEQPFRGYSALQGMSQSSATAISQDAAGYLWVGSRRGLNRFDGSAFTHFTIASGLPDNFITAVTAEHSGMLWVGDARGNVSGMLGENVTVRVDPGEAQGSRVTDIRYFDDQVWVATEDNGLFRFDPDSDEPIMLRVGYAGQRVSNLVAHDDGLWFLVGGVLYQQREADGAPVSLMGGVLALTASDRDGLWLAKTGNQMGRLVDGEFEVRYSPALEDAVTEIVLGADGKLWAASANHLISMHDRQLADGLAELETVSYPILETQALWIDRESTLWIGSANGLLRHLGHRFDHFRIPDAFSVRTTWAIGLEANGTAYIGTNNRLLRRATNGDTTDLTARLGLPEGPVRDLLIDGDRVWLGIRGHGLYLYNKPRETAVRVPGTDGLGVLDLGLDQYGYLWVGTFADGLYSVNTETFALRQFKTPGDSSVYTLDIDDDGNIWYGIDHAGLAKLERRGSNAFGVSFYGSEYNLDDIEFDHVVAKSPTNLWIGGENGRLVNFLDGEILDYSEDSPLNDQTIYALYALSDRVLLLGGEQGLFYFDVETYRSHRYGPLQGFLGLEVNVHSTYLDPEGYLWLGTIDGPTRMDISMPPPVAATLRPEILNVQSATTRRALANGSELEWQEGGVQFDFEAISLELPGKIEFSYRLNGHDEMWSKPSRNRSVKYAGLDPGGYQFLVRARYPGQNWQTNSQGFRFELKAPFWRHPVLLLMTLLGVLGVIAFMIRLRTSRIHSQNERLRAEVEERTRSIEDGRIELMKRNDQLHREVEQRRKADAARAELEERFRIAFQSTPIGMALLDRDGFVLNSNRALRRMFLGGTQLNEEISVGVDSRDFVTTDEREKYEKYLRKVTDMTEGAIEFEIPCQGHAGEVLSAVVSMTPVYNDANEFLYSIAQVQDVTESRRLTDKLEYQANYDELSGLLNRRSFEAALTKAFERAGDAENPSFLMFMDLDQFKIVNDTSGHTAGDELLRQISQLIRERVRDNDIVGRLGGDEFGLVLWQCPASVAQRVSESLRQAIEEYQFNWDAETYRIGISIGVVPIDPSLGTLAEIQQLADAACYEAKDNGRNRVHFAQSESAGIVEQRGDARWVQRLHDAMEHNRFALYGQILQPVRPTEGDPEPERMEILLRMRDPVTRKLIPPGAFLPAAERYGLSVKLDEWVVRSLLKMLFVHDAVGANDRRYWINLSGNSVGDQRFVDFLIDAITNSGLPRGMINFEITETAVIRNVSEAGRLMEALHDMGCQFALDDFGSGLSSFGYLKKLPVDYLKIDGMFIRDITSDETDRIFVKSIIDIARSMNIKTIAEFVENEEILDVVRELGADYAQGFGVHRPELIAPEFPSIHIPLARSVDQTGRMPKKIKEGTA